VLLKSKVHIIEQKASKALQDELAAKEKRIKALKAQKKVSMQHLQLNTIQPSIQLMGYWKEHFEI